MEEPDLNTVLGPTGEARKKKKRKALLPLFLLLLFLLLTTSCIVGFLLGRTSDPGRFGALIDTIILSPGTVDTPPPAGESPAAQESLVPGQTVGRLSLLGVVRYTGGAPFTQGSVRLQSEPRYSQLSETGRFRFDQVEDGLHKLTVLDLAGSEVASRMIEVDRDAGDMAYIEYEEALCILHIKVLTIRVNVELTLEEGPDGELTLELVNTVEEEAGPDLRPSASPAESDGHSLVGSAAPVWDPTAPPAETGGVPPTATPEAPPSPTPSAAPTVTPSPTPSPTPTATASARPAPSSKPSQRPGGKDDDDDGDGGGGGGGSIVPPKPTPTPTPAVPITGETEVYHGKSEVTWTQRAEIDLFRPLDGASDRLIAPGSEGYYLFRLRNGRDEEISFTLGLLEGNFHVPLEYRVTTDDLVPVPLTDWQSASTEQETVSRAVKLKAAGEKLYRIEWRWLPDGDDSVDTALGRREDRIYTLKLTIRAEGGA